MRIFKLQIVLLSLIMFSCLSDFTRPKEDFMNDFDLKLTGRVISIKSNNYGQKIVCLDVLESNYENYFPIHDPNKYLKESNSSFQKRFFVKIEGKKAIFIYHDDVEYRHINKNISKGAIITINEDDKKSYRVYDSNKSEKFGGLTIMTYPIRDNIEISCLGSSETVNSRK